MSEQKKSKQYWFNLFYETYSSLDQHKVLERISTSESQEEIKYLRMWHKKEVSIGGLYNHF